MIVLDCELLAGREFDFVTSAIIYEAGLHDWFALRD